MKLTCERSICGTAQHDTHTGAECALEAAQKDSEYARARFEDALMNGADDFVLYQRESMLEIQEFWVEQLREQDVRRI